MTKWQWNNSADVRYKKCFGCNKPMILALDGAIIYQDKDWHLHCLLDKLTDEHERQVNLFDSSYHAP